MSDDDRELTSEDFLEFTSDELIDELARRCRTMVLGIEFPPDCEAGAEDFVMAHQPNVGLVLYGNPFSYVGISDFLAVESRRRAFHRMKPTDPPK